MSTATTAIAMASDASIIDDIAQAGGYADFVRAARPPIESPEASMVWMFLMFGAVIVLGGLFIWARYIHAPSEKAKEDACKDCPELSHLSQRLDNMDSRMTQGFRETHSRIDGLFTAIADLRR